MRTDVLPISWVKPLTATATVHAATSTVNRSFVPKSTSIDKFANRIPAKVRDNGDMELAPGDRIRHDDFGEGRVDAVTGEGAKRVAHVRFDSAGAKKLLIKIAPIEKL